MDTLPRIFFHLRNKDANNDILDLLPHFEYLGMLVTYRFLPGDEDSLTHSLPVYKEFCTEYSITPDYLKALATDSLHTFFTPRLFKLTDFAIELQGGAPAADLYGTSVTDMSAVYICSNQYRLFSAQFLLSLTVLKSLAASFGGSYYILPSSTHELLLVPKSSGRSPKELQEILLSMNTNEISAVNILSNDLFFFDGKESRLSICRA